MSVSVIKMILHCVSPLSAYQACGSFSLLGSLFALLDSPRLRNLLFNFPLLLQPPPLPPFLSCQKISKISTTFARFALCLHLPFRARKFWIFPQGGSIMNGMSTKYLKCCSSIKLRDRTKPLVVSKCISRWTVEYHEIHWISSERTIWSCKAQSMEQNHNPNYDI